MDTSTNVLKYNDENLNLLFEKMLLRGKEERLDFFGRCFKMQGLLRKL